MNIELQTIDNIREIKIVTFTGEEITIIKFEFPTEPTQEVKTQPKPPPDIVQEAKKERRNSFSSKRDPIQPLSKSNSWEGGQSITNQDFTQYRRKPPRHSNHRRVAFRENEDHERKQGTTEETRVRKSRKSRSESDLYQKQQEKKKKFFAQSTRSS